MAVSVQSGQMDAVFAAAWRATVTCFASEADRDLVERVATFFVAFASRIHLGTDGPMVCEINVADGGTALREFLHVD